MKKLKIFNENNIFFKNILILMGSSIVVQIINIGISPILTRIYSPDDYGKLTLYVAILGIINLIGSLSYEYAIPIAKDDSEGFNILIFCLFCLGITSLILLLILNIYGDIFFTLFKAKEIQVYKYFIVIGLLFSGLYTIFSQWAYRKKNFKAITFTKYNQSISGNIIKLILGFSKIGALGLITGNIVSQSAGIITFFRTFIQEFKSLFNKVNFIEIKRLAKRYKNFPFYTTPSVLVLSLTSQLPILFMASIYGSEYIGLYGLARNISFLPMSLVGKSIQDVFYSEIANIGKEGAFEIRILVKKLLKKLILVGSIPAVVLFFFGPLLFSKIFGLEWEQSGEIARIISIEVFFHFIFQPINSIFLIFEEQKKALYINLVRLLLVIIIFNYANIYKINSNIIIFIYSIGMASTEMLKYFFIKKILRNRIKDI